MKVIQLKTTFVYSQSQTRVHLSLTRLLLKNFIYISITRIYNNNTNKIKKVKTERREKDDSASFLTPFRGQTTISFFSLITS